MSDIRHATPPRGTERGVSHVEYCPTECIFMQFRFDFILTKEIRETETGRRKNMNEKRI